MLIDLDNLDLYLRFKTIIRGEICFIVFLPIGFKGFAQRQPRSLGCVERSARLSRCDKDPTEGRRLCPLHRTGSTQLWPKSRRYWVLGRQLYNRQLKVLIDFLQVQASMLLLNILNCYR